MIQANFFQEDATEQKIEQIRSSELTRANFDTCQFSNDQVTKLAKVLETTTTLTYINLADCNLTADNLKQLAPAFQKNTSITEVVLDDFIKASEEYKDFTNKIRSSVERNCASQSKKAPSSP